MGDPVRAASPLPLRAEHARSRATTLGDDSLALIQKLAPYLSAAAPTAGASLGPRPGAPRASATVTLSTATFDRLHQALSDSRRRTAWLCRALHRSLTERALLVEQIVSLDQMLTEAREDIAELQGEIRSMNDELLVLSDRTR